MDVEVRARTAQRKTFAIYLEAYVCQSQRATVVVREGDGSGTRLLAPTKRHASSKYRGLRRSGAARRPALGVVSPSDSIAFKVQDAAFRHGCTQKEYRVRVADGVNAAEFATVYDTHGLVLGVLLRTTRAIQEGEEITASYGWDYWSGWPHSSA